MGDCLPRVIHFEINAEKPEQIAKFYEDVFDWKIEKWNGPMDYWMIMTGEEEQGIDGGLVKRTETSMPPVNTISVPSIDNYLKKIKENKGIIVVPKQAIPGIGWTAYFRDPEGNSFGLLEEDPEAK
jgi:predicted enzyme related to lactoylglutathione lyase